MELKGRFEKHRTRTNCDTPNSKTEAITGSRLLFSFSQPTSPANKAQMR